MDNNNIFKKIDFRQSKYILCGMSYVGVLIVGGLVFWMFDTEIQDVGPSNLVTKESLNSDLPTANVSDEITGKRQAVSKVFGDISDLSGVDNIQDDRDSLSKKEDFESKYSEEEARKVEEQQKKSREELERTKRQLAEQKARAEKMSSGMSENDFQLPLTAEERERARRMRQNGMMADIERDLGTSKQSGQSGETRYTGGVTANVQTSETGASSSFKQKKEENEEEKISKVTKKTNETSKSFNTISSNEKNSKLINAIVDEEVKAVDGSRVRLRILDDIEVDGLTLKKGSYLYATMSGFSQQRVKGTVNSVMIDEEIHKINLSIYDTDGLEGLYVPSSSFRETAKDVGSSALSNNMNINDNTSSGNSVTQWAMQGIQNAYQKTSNAISKAIKTNRVRVKYGTKVYLINGKSQKKKK